MPCLDLHLDLVDLLVELLQVLQQAVDQLSEQPRQLVARILDQVWYSAGDEANPLGHDHPVLCQEAADLVGLGCARLDKGLSHAVQRQHRLLLGVLDRHEPHSGPTHGLADSLGVSHIVLVALDVRLDELGSHQAHGVPHGLKLARPMVSATARFNADQARLQVCEERRDLVAPELLA